MQLATFLDTLRAVGIADLIDMALVAALIYSLLLWFKHTKAAFVARGIIVVLTLYLMAKLTGMYLTTWLFQGFFAIFLITLVVIFQEELRSFFERVAIWSMGHPNKSPLRPPEVETIVRVVGQFARGRTGALIVLKGTDPLERHLDGGSDLDGRLSTDILLSIFDPHSDGHDGAVIIEGNRITRFGVHLPLSKDFQKLPGMGTRHAAALGLAERTDALCVVVSEEKGGISIARGGNVYEISSLSQLEIEIAFFLEDREPSAATPSLFKQIFRGRLTSGKFLKNLQILDEKIMHFIQAILPFHLPTKLHWTDFWRRNMREKFISAVFAALIWMAFVQAFKPAIQEYRMPVIVTGIPEDLRLTAVTPKTIYVRVEGLHRDLNRLKSRNLKAYFELEEPGVGKVTMSVSDENFRLPEALELIAIEPRTVDFHLGKKQRRRVVNNTPPEIVKTVDPSDEIKPLAPTEIPPRRL